MEGSAEDRSRPSKIGRRVAIALLVLLAGMFIVLVGPVLLFLTTIYTGIVLDPGINFLLVPMLMIAMAMLGGPVERRLGGEMARSPGEQQRREQLQITAAGAVAASALLCIALTGGFGEVRVEHDVSQSPTPAILSLGAMAFGLSLAAHWAMARRAGRRRAYCAFGGRVTTTPVAESSGTGPARRTRLFLFLFAAVGTGWLLTLGAESSVPFLLGLAMNLGSGAILVALAWRGNRRRVLVATGVASLALPILIGADFLQHIANGTHR